MRENQTDLDSNIKRFETLDKKEIPGSYFEDLASIHAENEKCFSLSELFQGIFSKLHPLFSIDCGALVLYNEEMNYITRAYLAEVSSGEISCTETVSDPVSLSLMTKEIAEFDFPILKSRQNWVEDFGENHCLTNHPTEYHFHCYIPLESNGRTFGTFELHNHNRELSADGLTFCCNIAEFLAGLLQVMEERETPGNQQKLSKVKSGGDSEISNSLYQLLNDLSGITAHDEIVNFIERYFCDDFNADYCKLLIKPHQDFLIDFTSVKDGFQLLDLSVIGEQIAKKEHLDLWNEIGIKYILAIPLTNRKKLLGQVLIGFKQSLEISNEKAKVLKAVSNIISWPIEHLLAEEKIRHQQTELAIQTGQLSAYAIHEIEETDQLYTHPVIVGNSAEMQQVFKLLDRISSSETTVLILGETGTGKELIAKAVHDASGRKQKTMIKVNCAAIPPNLIESELFGHERGSFTGATERRIGKFEQAHKGTIFLDEIGELSLDLQVKLLRVLQEKELERVGGKTTIPVDVRIISATNRNLLEEVNAGRFRQDLFYRLNVFPVLLPPLRSRKTDIPVLAQHFLNKFAQKLNRKLQGFSKKAIASMLGYSWPGNVRELEHLIERQIVITTGNIIKEVEIPGSSKAAAPTTIAAVKTLFENERDHVFSVLESCNGKISGPNGAAKLLGVPATTLNSKIKKLGLAKRHIF
ncbi:sigma 54-interacting transcriptional regulator [Pedobacter sp. N23S346]|uniref:sigma 54-interacting transcriptional regulator n=1 Tax=Pedobacter sp. N23S346 TaxID=3402750 RepID=UPI003AC9411F